MYPSLLFLTLSKLTDIYPSIISNRVETHLHSWTLSADTSSPEEQEDNTTLSIAPSLTPSLPRRTHTSSPTQALNATLACVSYSARSQRPRSKLRLWIKEMRCKQTAAAQSPDLRLTTSNRPSNRHARRTLRNRAKAHFRWCWSLSDRAPARLLVVSFCFFAFLVNFDIKTNFVLARL